MGDFTSPAPLSAEHELLAFDSGEATLDEWLKKRAFKNQLTGASRCFVTCMDGEVAGYYSLSAGAVARSDVLKHKQRNQPNPLPVILLGRLAIDRAYHNQGLGSALLRDALLRVANVSREAGVFAVLVHALSEPAKRFYLCRGFIESPLKPMTLMMTMDTVREILTEG